MLSKQHCPHTGIVNFFAKSEPYVSVGSIVCAGTAGKTCHWRLYDATRAISGIADDMAAAELRLTSVYRRNREADAQTHA